MPKIDQLTGSTVLTAEEIWPTPTQERSTASHTNRTKHRRITEEHLATNPAHALSVLRCVMEHTNKWRARQFLCQLPNDFTLVEVQKPKNRCIFRSRSTGSVAKVEYDNAERKIFVHLSTSNNPDPAHVRWDIALNIGWVEGFST